MKKQQKVIALLLIALILFMVGSIFLGVSIANFRAVSTGKMKVSGESAGNIRLTIQEPPTIGGAGE